jgi:erythromycin esterase
MNHDARLGRRTRQHVVLVACGLLGMLVGRAAMAEDHADASRLASAPTFSGIATHDTGVPAAGGLVVVSSPRDGHTIEVIPIDRAGRYRAALPPGKYAITAATDRGFAWVPSQDIPDLDGELRLSTQCHPTRGRVEGRRVASYVILERHGSHGGRFAARLGANGSFVSCLAEGQYELSMGEGAHVSRTNVDVPQTDALHVIGFADAEVRQPAPKIPIPDAGRARVLHDILAAKPAIVGLGEATHGNAEFVSARSELTMELIRQAKVRLLLFELDAIQGVALDDYINGANVEVAKVVADLGFWTTDTYEFIQFLAQLRQYNVDAEDKIHLWGIDAQNTTPPVDVLVNAARELTISPSELATLKLMTKRGKAVKDLDGARRAELEALLARLGAPRGPTRHDLLIAVAAQSLELQLGYWVGDMPSWYGRRRDAGMARLATLLVSGLGARPACLWAHDEHVSRLAGEASLGEQLARSPLTYYAVGFYFYQGSVRAWDVEGKIGVISHPLPPAPAYTVESALLHAAGMPELAWVPLRGLPRGLAEWFKRPRFMRELGNQYAVDLESLREVPAAFDALVVIRTVHDSTPTPTGVRAVTTP